VRLVGNVIVNVRSKTMDEGTEINRATFNLMMDSEILSQENQKLKAENRELRELVSPASYKMLLELQKLRNEKHQWEEYLLEVKDHTDALHRFVRDNELNIFPKTSQSGAV
jgi:hypothetical protein